MHFDGGAKCLGPESNTYNDRDWWWNQFDFSGAICEQDGCYGAKHLCYGTALAPEPTMYTYITSDFGAGRNIMLL